MKILAIKNWRELLISRFVIHLTLAMFFFLKQSKINKEFIRSAKIAFKLYVIKKIKRKLGVTGHCFIMTLHV